MEKLGETADDYQFDVMIIPMLCSGSFKTNLSKMQTESHGFTSSRVVTSFLHNALCKI